jgi:hypothetical protein
MLLLLLYWAGTGGRGGVRPVAAVASSIDGSYDFDWQKHCQQQQQQG